MQQPSARTRLAVDIGGTFTDLVLALPDRTLSTKLLTTHARTGRGGDRGHSRRYCPRPACSGVVARAGDPWHDACHQCADRTQGCANRADHHCRDFAIRWRSPTNIASSNTICIWNGRSRWFRATCGWRCRSVLRRMVRCCWSWTRRRWNVWCRHCEQHDIEAVAISFLHSYINPAHEERARELIARRLPDDGAHHFLRGVPRDSRIRTDLHRRGECLRAADDGALSWRACRMACVASA